MMGYLMKSLSLSISSEGDNLSVKSSRDPLSLTTPFPLPPCPSPPFLEQAFRDTLNLLIRSEMSGESKQHSYSQLMLLVIQSVQQSMASPLCPFLMMSDIFDSSTLQECEPFFRFVETNVDVWKSDIFFDKGKNYLLRMSNDLLRRLSRSQNTIFCGRIQLFLAHLFPLKEKSGLNLVSQSPTSFLNGV